MTVNPSEQPPVIVKVTQQPAVQVRVTPPAIVGVSTGTIGKPGAAADSDMIQEIVEDHNATTADVHGVSDMTEVQKLIEMPSLTLLFENGLI